MLMLGKVLEGFHSVGSGKIKAASRAEEAGVATLGAFIHQGGPDDIALANVILCKNCTLAGLNTQQNRKTG